MMVKPKNPATHCIVPIYRQKRSARSAIPSSTVTPSRSRPGPPPPRHASTPRLLDLDSALLYLIPPHLPPPTGDTSPPSHIRPRLSLVHRLRPGGVVQFCRGSVGTSTCCTTIPADIAARLRADYFRAIPVM
ncbi:Hypothetical protein NTJ_03432 [Nesidiocoris tenuis]|uniref:Uncharacterized protein n=1 Tax=Nesidiocoris tenuis TaxID=355587 RepID=A0ABN7AEF1_9HEMI|nr:Hypothetical protein NTJ_03432 [Nesidiocoris tenuis]